LIIIADENYKFPATWTKEDYIFEFCDFGCLEGVKGIKDNIHKVQAFIYRKSLENLPVANKSNKRGDVFDMKTRKDALQLFLKKHRNKVVWEK